MKWTSRCSTGKACKKSEVSGVTGCVSTGRTLRKSHLGDVSKHSKHTDAPVLDLHVPKAVKPLLVGVLQPVERVPEPERCLSAEFVLEVHLHRGRGLGPGGQGSAVEGADTRRGSNKQETR